MSDEGKGLVDAFQQIITERIVPLIEELKQQGVAVRLSSDDDKRTINNVIRHEYRVLTADEKSAMLAVKDAGLVLIQEIEKLPPCRESSLAVTKAQEAVMWAVNGLTK